METNIKSAEVATDIVKTSRGITYERTEPQRRWLSWNIRSKFPVSQFNGPKQSYAGTVSDKVIAERRAKNKVAKASRKANR